MTDNPLKDFRREMILHHGNRKLLVKDFVPTTPSRGNFSNLNLTPPEGRC